MKMSLKASVDNWLRTLVKSCSSNNLVAWLASSAGSREAIARTSSTGTSSTTPLSEIIYLIAISYKKKKTDWYDKNLKYVHINVLNICHKCKKCAE